MPTPHPDRGIAKGTHPASHSNWYRAVQEMQAAVFILCKHKGWYDRPVDFPTAIALMHSEVSEALLAWRDHGFQDVFSHHPDPNCEECRTAGILRAGAEDEVQGTTHPEWNNVRCPYHPPKPESVGSEMADVLIRLLDDAERFGVDLVFEFERKMAYNATRPYRHGRTNPEGI